MVFFFYKFLAVESVLAAQPQFMSMSLYKMAPSRSNQDVRVSFVAISFEGFFCTVQAYCQCYGDRWAGRSQQCHSYCNRWKEGWCVCISHKLQSGLNMSTSGEGNDCELSGDGSRLLDLCRASISSEVYTTCTGAGNSISICSCFVFIPFTFC